MLRNVLIIGLALQITCCPVECRLGACLGCSSCCTQTQEVIRHCSCCATKSTVATDCFDSCHAKSAPNSDAEQNSPSGKLPNRCEMWNCICNGALKSEGAPVQDPALDLQALCDVHVASWVDVSRYENRWTPGPLDTGQFASGRQIRIWFDSFLC